MKNNRFFLSFISLLFLLTAFLTRLQFIPSQRLWPDEALYVSQANDIGRNFYFLFSREANEYHVPLFSFLLSLGRSLLSPPVEGYRFLAIIFNWAGLLAAFLLAKKLLGVRTAVFALAILAMNRLYLNNAGFILADSLLAAAQTCFILSLYRLDHFSKRNAAFFLASALMMIYLKWYAVLFVLPITIGYCLCFPPGQNLKKIAMLVLAVCLASIPVLIKILSIMKAGGPAIFHPAPWWYYFSVHSRILGGLLPLILFIYGGIILKAKNYKAFVLLGLWISGYLAVLSCVSEKDTRYMLPVIPCTAIVCGYGLRHAITGFFDSAFMRQTAWRSMMVLLLVICAASTFRVVLPNSNRYIGYYEAGEWITKNSRVDSVILAGSIRAIHCVTGIPLKRFGGRLEPLPRSLEELKGELSRTKGMILEIDAWEYSQPQWAYPWSNEKERELERQTGLRLSKVIYKKIEGRQAPVVWLLSR